MNVIKNTPVAGMKIMKMNSKLTNVNLTKKESKLIYEACMFCYPEFKGLEYQCKGKQLEVFKKLVIGFWYGRSVVQLGIKAGDKNNED